MRALLLIISILLYHPLLAEATELPKLSIVTEDVYPMGYRDKETGDIKGFATEYLEDILAEANISYSLDMFPWPRAYNIALTKDNILIYGLARTKEREDKFIWLTDFITLDFYLYGLKSRQAELMANSTDFKHRSIAVIRNDFNHVEMVANGYDNLIPAEGHVHMTTLLKRNRVDFIVASGTGLDNFDIRHDLDKLDLYQAQPLTFLNVPIYFAFSKNTDPKIVEKMQQAVARLKTDNDYKQPYIPYIPRK